MRSRRENLLVREGFRCEGPERDGRGAGVDGGTDDGAAEAGTEEGGAAGAGTTGDGASGEAMGPVPFGTARPAPFGAPAWPVPFGAVWPVPFGGAAGANGEEVDGKEGRGTRRGNGPGPPEPAC
jgi:hypothetical protein